MTPPSLRLALLLGAGLAGCTCSGEPSSPAKPDTGAKRSPGIEAFHPSAVSVPKAPNHDAGRFRTLLIPLQVPSWTLTRKSPAADQLAAQRARVAFAQAAAGYRYARTGEGRIILQPLPARGDQPIKMIKAPRRELGLSRHEATGELPDPGGQLVLVTGAYDLPGKGRVKINPPHLQAAFQAALKKAAEQLGGSGRILPLWVSEARLQGRVIQLDLKARVLLDGQATP